jgi:hypothetical protein
MVFSIRRGDNMGTAFKQWLEEFMESDEFMEDSFHWDDMSKSAYKAGLQRAIGLCGSNKVRETGYEVDYARNVAVDDCIAAMQKEIDGI